MREYIALNHGFDADHVCWFSSGSPGSPQPTIASSVVSSLRYQSPRMYCENPSSIPAMSGLLSGPFCPVTTSPPYSFARNALYEAGSLKMFALVIELLGWTVRSPHATVATSTAAAFASHFVDGLNIYPSLLLVAW